MNDAMFLVMAFFAGVALGGIFFGGLWWTVRKGASSARPAIWFLASLIIRMTAILTGFYLVGQGRWERLVSCLLGFVGARLAVTWMTRRSLANRPAPSPEGTHAPDA